MGVKFQTCYANFLENVNAIYQIFPHEKLFVFFIQIRSDNLLKSEAMEK